MAQIFPRTAAMALLVIRETLDHKREMSKGPEALTKPQLSEITQYSQLTAKLGDHRQESDQRNRENCGDNSEASRVKGNWSVDFDATVDGVMKKRGRVSRRLRCRARVVLKFSGLDGYAIHFFGECHSHPLASHKHKRRNFAAFGDSVSFDATYNTNRYKMEFTSFTGKDNLGKYVTFGVALLSSENTESYCWILEKFKDCMGRSPSILITDQDPALKNAMKYVFHDMRHRLCMWHIMLKFSERVPPHLKKDKSLRKKVNKIVWSDVIELVVFKKKWQEIMSEYGFTDIPWFKSMYDL
ncbi:hypothetical protein C2S51_007297 [Perilla frutescens var. frutescens]|nr:hypothetical protein C2S51_007297 [Perilla frutescens var. frutescens]